MSVTSMSGFVASRASQVEREASALLDQARAMMDDGKEKFANATMREATKRRELYVKLKARHQGLLKHEAELSLNGSVNP